MNIKNRTLLTLAILILLAGVLLGMTLTLKTHIWVPNLQELMQEGRAGGEEAASAMAATAAVRAINYLPKNPEKAKEMMVILTAHYYNTYGPPEDPNFFVRPEGKELLEEIQKLAKKDQVLAKQIGK